MSVSRTRVSNRRRQKWPAKRWPSAAVVAEAMSAYYQEFEELHKLLERKLGDLRHCYRIEGQQRTLAVYDIFNSQKVNDYLRREGGGKSLVPGEIDERLLQKRFAIAFRIVSQDHGLQNEDPAFCANAQKIL